MKKTVSIIWNIIQVLIILYVVVLTILMFSRNSYGFIQIGSNTLYSVGDNSISNAHKGDLLIFKNSSSIKVGDSIYYYSIDSQKYIVSKDKVNDIQNSGKTVLYSLDSNIKVLNDKIVGKSYVRIPVLGKLFNALQSKAGFLFFVLLPILIVVIYHVYRFVRRLV